MTYDLLYLAYMGVYDVESCFLVRIFVDAAMQTGDITGEQGRVLCRLIGARMKTFLRGMEEPAAVKTAHSVVNKYLAAPGYKFIGYDWRGKPVYILDKTKEPETNLRMHMFDA